MMSKHGITRKRKRRKKTTGSRASRNGLVNVRGKRRTPRLKGRGGNPRVKIARDQGDGSDHSGNFDAGGWKGPPPESKKKSRRCIRKLPYERLQPESMGEGEGRDVFPFAESQEASVQR